MEFNKIYQGHCLDVLKTFSDQSVNTVITSPPYWGLRDYGEAEQIGLEETPEKYIENMVQVFQEIKRVLKDDGTVWLNLGDCYWANRSKNGLEYIGNKGKSKDYMLRAGGSSHEYLKPKDLIGLPWRVAFALQQDGWYLRQDIVWNKPNPMPESVKDRPTKSHEYIFLLSKSHTYFYDHEAIKEDAIYGTQDVRGSRATIGQPQKQRRLDKARGSFKGKYGKEAFRAIRDKRNKRSVWTVTTKPLRVAHFATFPEDLIEPCVLAGSPKGGVVMDPFCGSGTTGLVALKYGRNFLGIELNPEYIKIAENRLSGVQLELINSL